jgi:hypothetical protein
MSAIDISASPGEGVVAKRRSGRYCRAGRPDQDEEPRLLRYEMEREGWFGAARNPQVP